MSYVPPTVPERWDTGLWDQAHWDGQLGLQVAAGSFLFNGQPVTLLLSRVLVANTGSFVFTTPDAGIAKGLSAVLDDGSFVFNGPDVDLVYQINHLVPETGTFVFSYPDIGLYQGGVLHAGDRHVRVRRGPDRVLVERDDGGRDGRVQFQGRLARQADLPAARLLQSGNEGLRATEAVSDHVP